MLRCPTCNAVYSVAEGFCPMDGATLVAEDVAIVPPLVVGNAPTKKGGFPRAGAKVGASSLSNLPASKVKPVPGRSGKPGEQKATIVGAYFPRGGLSIPRAELEQRPHAPPEETIVGKVLDQRYEIISKLGSGGMAIVFRGRHVIIDKPVAVKVLRSEHMRQEEVAQRFLQEAQLASRIKHPNVVEVSDYGQLASNRLCYYVMEYLEGQTLAHRIDHGEAIAPAEAINFAQQILAGLQVAHDSGVIHRDLKPDNIFLTRDPQDGGPLAKILDFGIARALDRKTRLTAAGTVIGTPEYMSPEQAQGHEIDGRSDLYALGVIVFEMLTGKVPFNADTTLSALTQHVFEPPPRLKDVCPELPDLKHIEAVLEMLMAKLPEQRPDSCNHASALLLAALEKDRRAIEAGPRVRTRRKTVEIGSNSVVIKVDDDDDDLPDFDAPKSPQAEVRHPGDPVSIVRGDTGQVQPRTFGVSERYRSKQPSVIVARDGVERFEKPAPRRQIRPAPPVQTPPETASPSSRGWIVGLSLVAAIVGAGLTVYLFQTFREKPPPRAAPAPVGKLAPVTGESTTPQPIAEVSPLASETRAVTLTFASEPSGATVLGPKGILGQTPLSLRVAANEHRQTFKFELASHDPVEREFVPNTDSDIRVVLEPARSTRRQKNPRTSQTGDTVIGQIPAKSPTPESKLGSAVELDELKDPFADSD